MSDKKLYMDYDPDTNSLKDCTDEIELSIEELNTLTEVEPEEVEVEEEPEEVVEEEPIDESLVGTVAGCVKLNIRKEPNVKGEVVCTVPEKSALLIDPALSTDEWYKVYTETGMEGFCMKKFVEVNQ